jgi:hypothetical protein
MGIVEGLNLDLYIKERFYDMCVISKLLYKSKKTTEKRIFRVFSKL